ncbi:MAG: hypothetical protein ACOYW9_11140 [Deinococcota bacterium]
MGEAAKVLARLSFEEYLALEEKAPFKHELVDGVNHPTAKAGGFRGQNHADSHGSLPPGTGGLHRPSGFDPAAK